MSSEATNSRSDCGFSGVPDPVSKERVRGIRVFDIRDVQHPKLLANVQTCRGSHTHTVVTQPGDTENVYIYVSGTARVRSAEELPGCQDGGIDDPNTARFRLEVIKVPLATPAQAAIVSSPRIFNGLPVPPRNADRDALDAKARAEAAAARGAARRRARPAAAGRWKRGTERRSAERSQPVPRHHGLPGGRPRGRCMRGPRPAARHPRRGAPGPHRRGVGRQHVVLALGDVQQRRQEDPVHRRVGRRHAAALPRHRQAGVGRRCALHDRGQQAQVPHLLQNAGARRRGRRTASRTTAR